MGTIERTDDIMAPDDDRMMEMGKGLRAFMKEGNAGAFRLDLKALMAGGQQNEKAEEPRRSLPSKSDEVQPNL